MPKLDRLILEQRTTTDEPIDECANDDCQKPIFTGVKVWKLGPDLLCSGSCLAKALQANKQAMSA